MFTVNLVSHENGMEVETFYTTRSFKIWHNDIENYAILECYGFGNNIDDAYIPITGGDPSLVPVGAEDPCYQKVFIMNDNGKTVKKYVRRMD